jgi:hypothetical protein
MKDENGDMVPYFLNILNRWKNYFRQLLNVHGVNDVRQREMHRTEPLVELDPSSLEIEVAIENLKRYKSPCTDQILAELIHAGGNTLLSEIQRLIKSV